LNRTRTPNRKRLGRPHPNTKRNPEGTGRNRCFLERAVSVRLPQPGPGWVSYNAQVVPEVSAHNGLVRFKKSLRWCGGSKAPQLWHHIPFIDHRGHIHATSVGRWKCTAPQLLATITSTVFKRLWGRTRKGPIPNRVKSGLLYRIAQIYSITNDDSFFRRTLCMLSRRRDKELLKFVYYKEKHMDDNNRFLYDQASFGATWFQSRQDRCPGRAMSNQMIKVQRDGRPTYLTLRCHFDRTVTAWARVYSGASAHPKTVVRPLGIGQPFFRGYLHGTG